MTENIQTLKLFIPIADGIARTVGENCEVAIHDLSHPQSSIFYIVNGHLTGRKQGDSLGPAFRDIVSIARNNQNMIINYYDNIKRQTFKATKILISNDKGKVIGCFCINIVIDDYLHALATVNQLCETQSIDSFKETPDDAQNDNGDRQQIVDMVRDVIINTYQDTVKGKKRLRKADKLEFIKFLEDKGIFNVKGSVEQVAQTLRVSKFSIYNYLDEVRTKNGGEVVEATEKPARRPRQPRPKAK